jgi:hypothetical protein
VKGIEKSYSQHNERAQEGLEAAEKRHYEQDIGGIGERKTTKEARRKDAQHAEQFQPR